MIGFACEAIIFFIMGALYVPISQIPGLFVVLYGLTFFFSNMGPNTTTYVLSAEAFPKSIRSTSHGISACSGKIGALIGTAGFPTMITAVGVGPVFYLCGVISVLGFIMTAIFIPETKGTELPDEEEDQKAELERQPSKRGSENSEKESNIVVV